MDGLCGFGYICVETFAQYGHNSIYIFSFVTFEQCFVSLYKCVCVCVCLCRLSLSIEIKTSKLLQKVKSSGWLANTIHCIVDSMVYFLPPLSLSLCLLLFFFVHLSMAMIECHHRTNWKWQTLFAPASIHQNKITLNVRYCVIWCCTNWSLYELDWMINDEVEIKIGV